MDAIHTASRLAGREMRSESEINFNAEDQLVEAILVNNRSIDPDHIERALSAPILYCVRN
jgi:hypothetical protein